MLQYHGCGGDFIVRLYLIPLTSGQSCEKFHQIFFTIKPNTAMNKGLRLGVGTDKDARRKRRGEGARHRVLDRPLKLKLVRGRGEAME